MMSRNTFHEPQPDSASIVICYICDIVYRKTRYHKSVLKSRNVAVAKGSVRFNIFFYTSRLESSPQECELECSIIRS